MDAKKPISILREEFIITKVCIYLQNTSNSYEKISEKTFFVFEKPNFVE